MRILKTLLLLGLVVALTIGACSAPAAARSPAINDIQPNDVIFVYETGLNMTDLRNQTTNNPITELRQYLDDDRSKAPKNQIPVSDDTDFTIMDVLVPKNSVPMTVWAWNPTDGNTNSVMIYYPEVSIEAVLASNQADSVTGLSIPDGTSIAFKVTSPQVGSWYHDATTWPTTIDILLTMPGGAQTTNIGGTNLARMRIDSAQFYTNDPGKPGAVTLTFKDQGIYTFQAEWSAPSGFKNYAAKSNEISINYGGRANIGDGTATATATPEPTQEPTVLPTTAPTPVPTELPTTVPAETVLPTPDKTAPPVTELPTQAPTATPLSVLGCLGAFVIGLLVITHRKK